MKMMKPEYENKSRLSIPDLVFILLTYIVQGLLLFKCWKVLPSANQFVQLVHIIPHYLCHYYCNIASFVYFVNVVL